MFKQIYLDACKEIYKDLDGDKDVQKLITEIELDLLNWYKQGVPVYHMSYEGMRSVACAIGLEEAWTLYYYVKLHFSKLGVEMEFKGSYIQLSVKIET